MGGAVGFEGGRFFHPFRVLPPELLEVIFYIFGGGRRLTSTPPLFFLTEIE
jgi:hypothetical protein